MPTGIKRFKGQYIHSWEYKSPERFRGKKIIVVGIGNSGADLAVELSHVASQVWFLQFFFFFRDAPCPEPSELLTLHEICQGYPYTASILIVNYLLTLVFSVDILAIHLKNENGIKIKISNFSDHHMVYFYQNM